MRDTSRNPEPERPVLTLCCGSCSSRLVQVSDWAREQGARWSVRLWCPECWYQRRVALDQQQAMLLSLAVEDGLACLLDGLLELDELPTAEPGNGRRLRYS